MKFPQIKCQKKGENNLERIELYKKTQVFLEVIYKKLHFLVLNYEEKELQIFRFVNLNKLKKVKDISFDNSK